MLPEEAAVGVESLDGEHAVAAVAEDEEPPRGDAARGREPWPPTAQERAIAVPPNLDAPRLGLSAGGADDEGLIAADLRGELVGDALRIKHAGARKQDESVPRPGRSRARRRIGRALGTHQGVGGEGQLHPWVPGRGGRRRHWGLRRPQ